MHSNTKKIFNGAAWLGMSTIFIKIIGLVYKIPMSYLLGDEGMGYFNSAYTVYGFFYIIAIAGIPKAISILCAKSSDGEAKSIFIFVYRIYLLIGALLTVILFFFARPIAIGIGNINSTYTILVISPSVFFVCATGVIRGYLSGKTKFLPIAISEFISALCKLILGLLFAIYAIKRNFSLPITCAFSILGITLGSFFGFIYLYAYYKKESGNFKPEKIHGRKILKEVLSLGLPITFAAMISGIVNIIDLSVMMNALKSSGYSETVCTVIYGNYTTLAVPMFSFVTNLINTIALASLPVIAGCFSKNEYGEIQKSVSSSLKLLFFISIPAFFAFFLFPIEILGIIFEEGSVRLGSTFLYFLAPGILFYSLLSLTNTVLEANGRIKAAVFSLTVGAISKSLLGVFIVNSEEIGALGAPVSTTVSYFISAILSLIFYVKYIIKENGIKLHITNSCFSPIFSSAAASVLTLIIKRALPTTLSLRLSSLLILFFYGFSYLFFGILSTFARKKHRFIGNMHNKTSF